MKDKSFSLSENIAFPVILEGAELKFGKWEELARYENKDDLDYKMSAYAFPAMPFIRARAADGQTFEVDQAGMMEFHQHVERHNQDQTSPLSVFLKSAPEKALETAQELVNAGLHSKHFHISPRSRLLLEHPHLHHLRFFEFEDSVICKIFIEAAAETDTEPAVTIWKSGGFGVSPFTLDIEVQAFLVLLCATIVRDFWVLEERTRATQYQKRTEKHRRREGTGKDRKRIIEKEYTFIPRFRYDLSNYADRPRAISHQARVTLSPHLVSGHLRKLPDGWNVSDQAIQHAQEFGIHLQDGYTFVRPHERGEIERLQNYRSHSAFELVFGGGERNNQG